MIDKTYWKIAFACNSEKAYTELKCKFFSDPDFRNEVLDSIPEDKMKELKETYTATSGFKNLTFEEWFESIRRTGMIIHSYSNDNTFEKLYAVGAPKQRILDEIRKKT